MRLFIAEKPSLARAIAEALPSPREGNRRLLGGEARITGCLVRGDDVVAWCAGHILALAPPDAYDPGYKRWRLEHLLIVPGASSMLPGAAAAGCSSANWKLTVTAPELLRTIKALLPKASRVVHAGDPDREGQLLIDEVLELLGYRGPVDRLLISDLNPPAVRRALADLQSNARYWGLYQAALARQRADWLYGINLTRLYTLLGRAGGYDGVLSVGRVQTPLLGLIVRRDLEIEGFQPRAYFVVRADLRCAQGSFTATWQPPADEPGPAVDEAGRLCSREHALDVQAQVEGKPGAVTHCAREKKSEAQPLPYALPDLQIDASKRLGLSPRQVVDACQSLYEVHRLLTYPRSDCAFLPEGQHEQARAVLAAVATNLPSLVPVVGKADPSRRSRAWNDRKITAHHAIIPTLVSKPDADLSTAERGVYELVARRYLAQFYPPFEFHETTIEVSAGGQAFRAQGRQTLAEGWRAVVTATSKDKVSNAARRQ